MLVIDFMIVIRRFAHQDFLMSETTALRLSLVRGLRLIHLLEVFAEVYPLAHPPIHPHIPSLLTYTPSQVAYVQDGEDVWDLAKVKVMLQKNVENDEE